MSNSEEAPPRIYSGVSRRGSIEGAISSAIVIAKEDLRTDYVEWELEELAGRNGGFVLINEVTATILITGTSPAFGSKG